jgi:hypothetical protein
MRGLGSLYHPSTCVPKGVLYEYAESGTLAGTWLVFCPSGDKGDGVGILVHGTLIGSTSFWVL